jgi:hypothetical protein
VCTSGVTWTGGSGATMAPGRACVACHTGGEGGAFSAGGTVYPTAHEPDNCNGAASASVEITDANGLVVSLLVNAAGNFYTTAPLAFPIRARVLSGGKQRAMAGAVSSGDCNSCHTQSGLNAAPGRVVLP